MQLSFFTLVFCFFFFFPAVLASAVVATATVTVTATALQVSRYLGTLVLFRMVAIFVFEASRDPAIG